MSKKIQFKIGADPEFFVKQGDQNVSAYDLIPGTKEKPHRVTGGAVQVDGMALEFNVDPLSLGTYDPTNGRNMLPKSGERWITKIQTILSQMKDMVDDDYEFDFSPVAHFGSDYIQAQPDKAKELGCDPDYNAYTGQLNATPDADTPFRTASGHVHIGWTKNVDPLDNGHFEACRNLVRALDQSLGYVSLLWDSDTTRHKLYGNFGAFRPKSFGVEYRVMSNAWLKNPFRMWIVYKAVENTIGRMFNSQDYGFVEQPYIETNADGKSYKMPQVYTAFKGDLTFVQSFFSQPRTRTWIPILKELNIPQDEMFEILFLKSIGDYWGEPTSNQMKESINNMGYQLPETVVDWIVTEYMERKLLFSAMDELRKSKNSKTRESYTKFSARVSAKPFNMNDLVLANPVRLGE